MELIIKERNQIDNIEFNYEELKKELADKLVKYKGTTYDDSAIALAKKDRAALNNLKKAIDDKRKEIKNECLKPYNDFEAKVKDILGMIDKPVLEIDTQIKNYEERVKAEKKSEIETYFNENIGDLLKILKFNNVFNEKWLNATASMKSIKTEIDETIQRVNSDLEVIKGLNSEFDTELMNEYLVTFDLSAVLRKKTMLEERKKALAELEEKKKQQEAERQAARQQLAEQQAREQEQAQIESEVNQAINNTFDGNVTEKIENKPLQEKIYELDFRIWGTQKQIDMLKEFFANKGIKYGRVPKEREEK